MVIDVGVMKDLSGLAKAIKPTRLLAGRANVRVEDILKLWRFKSPGVRSGFGIDVRSNQAARCPNANVLEFK
ncbi:MAG: hypothetical protein IPJ16_08800 [Bacteroidales bacterium]|nr:hypothetical protein [Bacteroidales bacterium]